MNSENDTGRTSRNGGGNTSATPSIALLNRSVGTLARSPDADTIRNRLAEAQQGGNGPAGARSPREQKRHIADLKARLRDRFPRWSAGDAPASDSCALAGIRSTSGSSFHGYAPLGLRSPHHRSRYQGQAGIPARNPQAHGGSARPVDGGLPRAAAAGVVQRSPPERHAHFRTASGADPSSIRGLAACGRADHGVGPGSSSGAGLHGGWALP